MKYDGLIRVIIGENYEELVNILENENYTIRNLFLQIIIIL